MTTTVTHEPLPNCVECAPVIADDCIAAVDAFVSSNSFLRILVHESVPEVSVSSVQTRVIARPALPRVRGLSFASDCLQAFRTLILAKDVDVIICNGGSLVGKLTPALNSMLFQGRRHIVMWECFAQNNVGLRGWLNRLMLRGCKYVVVYSRKLVQVQSQLHRLPASKFVFIPYKANHSKLPPIKTPIGNYVFSGGNSSRDYKALFKSVEGTGIPVIVSTTQSLPIDIYDVPENVIVLAAREPFFARLMAGSRFVVMPILPGIVFGQAVASVSNAMWHGRPVIAADDAACSDYIEDGKTGYVVPAGDVEALRTKILELWNNSDLLTSMSSKTHDIIKEDRTHAIFWKRMIGLAILAVNHASCADRQ